MLRRRRAVLPLLGLAALVVAGVVLFLLRDGGPKLAEGSFASQGDGRWHVPEPVTMEGNRPERQLDLIYEQGKDATFTLSVRNDGKHAVTLTGASVLDADAMFAKRGVRFQPSPTLQPGQEAKVVYTGRFTGCGRYGRGSAVFTDRLTLFYGDGKTTDVDLRENVRIAAPRSCPEPDQP